MAIVDLTGTTWVFDTAKALALPTQNYTFTVDYTTNGKDYQDVARSYNGTSIVFYETSLQVTFGTGSNQAIYNSSNYEFPHWAWYYQNAFAITINGGTDATNATLIAWLEENAVQPKQISGAWKWKPQSELNLEADLDITEDVNALFVGFSGRVNQCVAIGFYSTDVPNLEVFGVREDGSKVWATNNSDWDSEYSRLLNFGDEEQTVSAEFYNFLIANAEPISWSDYYKTVYGKWKFKDNLTYAGYNEVTVNFTASVNYSGTVIIGQCDYLTYGYNFNVRVVSSVPDLSEMGFTLPLVLTLYNPEEENHWLYGVNYIDFGTESQYVSSEFYTWFTANAKRLSTITYNGATIATLNGGQTATIKCAGKNMESDVVVEVASGGSEANIVPLVVGANGTYSTDNALSLVTETWTENSNFDAGIVDFYGNTLSYAKAAKLVSDENARNLLYDRRCRIYANIGGEETEGALEGFDHTNKEAGVTLFYGGVPVAMWVKDADAFNYEFNITWAEENAVYVVNIFALFGATGEVSITAFGKCEATVYGFDPVEVALPMGEEGFSITPSRSEQSFKDGRYYKNFTVNPVYTKVATVRSGGVSYTVEPDSPNYYFSSVIVEPANIVNLGLLCDIDFVTLPTKTEYEFNEPLDMAGCVVRVHYTSGGTNTYTMPHLSIDVDTSELIMKDSAEYGRRIITVEDTKDGITCRAFFTVNVKSPIGTIAAPTLAYNQSANAGAKLMDITFPDNIHRKCHVFANGNYLITTTSSAWGIASSELSTLPSGTYDITVRAASVGYYGEESNAVSYTVE